jgi:hypothetical protein
MRARVPIRVAGTVVPLRCSQLTSVRR